MSSPATRGGGVPTDRSPAIFVVASMARCRPSAPRVLAWSEACAGASCAKHVAFGRDVGPDFGQHAPHVVHVDVGIDQDQELRELQRRPSPTVPRRSAGHDTGSVLRNETNAKRCGPPRTGMCKSTTSGAIVRIDGKQQPLPHFDEHGQLANRSAVDHGRQNRMAAVRNRGDVQDGGRLDRAIVQSAAARPIGLPPRELRDPDNLR